MFCQWVNKLFYYCKLFGIGGKIVVNDYMKLMELNDDFLLFDGDLLKMYKIPKDKLHEVHDYLENPRERHFAEVGSLDRLGRLTLCVSSVCNLACKYCYESQQNFCEHKQAFISVETIQKAINFVFSQYCEGIGCVQFFGGEPLLNIKAIRYTIEYISEICLKRSIKPPAYTIVTNGTLINEETHNLFNQYFGRITISLDGRKEINDANRVFAKHAGSVYENVSANLTKFAKDRKYLIDVQMTITECHLQNVNSDIIDYLHIKKLGVTSVHITPLINTKDYQVAEREKYTSRIIEYFRKCYEHEMQYIDKTNYYKLLSLVRILKEKTPSDHYCGAGFKDISIDVLGDIYPCFMFNDNPAFVMGNVLSDGKDFVANRDTYISNTISRNQKCANCWAHGICSSGHSGCIGAYYLENGRIDRPIEHNCALTKSVFENALCKIAQLT